jgi:hypothetical protein
MENVPNTQELDATVTRSVVSMWVLTALSAVFLGLRIYCKITNSTTRRLWIDDHVLIVAWVSTWTYTSGNISRG